MAAKEGRCVAMVFVGWKGGAEVVIIIDGGVGARGSPRDLGVVSLEPQLGVIPYGHLFD